MWKQTFLGIRKRQQPTGFYTCTLCSKEPCFSEMNILAEKKTDLFHCDYWSPIFTSGWVFSFCGQQTSVIEQPLFSAQRSHPLCLVHQEGMRNEKLPILASWRPNAMCLSSIQAVSGMLGQSEIRRQGCNQKTLYRITESSRLEQTLQNKSTTKLCSITSNKTLNQTKATIKDSFKCLKWPFLTPPFTPHSSHSSLMRKAIPDPEDFCKRYFHLNIQPLWSSLLRLLHYELALAVQAEA